MKAFIKKNFLKLLLVLCVAVIVYLFISFIIVQEVFQYNAQLNTTYKITMKQDILCLMSAYPGYVVGIEQLENDDVYLIMKSGKKIIYDDKRDKNIDEKINNPDVQDSMEQIYPLNDINSLMETNYDPGRHREYSLLNEVYGNSKQEVESNLINVGVSNSKYQFNGNNQAASSLEKVMDELIPLAESNKNIRASVFPCGGTFNYRYISGTSRLSPHSFGIAIDLAKDNRDYWKWASRKDGQKRLSSYPVEIVRIFEKNNFVWGGKWGHFDILHFEYRPEIILKARYFNEKIGEKGLWYQGAPIEDDYIRECIEKIDCKILN